MKRASAAAILAVAAAASLHVRALLPWLALATGVPPAQRESRYGPCSIRREACASSAMAVSPLSVDPDRRQVFIVGNEAADADSLVSAYAMAKLLDGGEVQAVALAQIPREEFRLRGDSLALFAQAGSDIASDGAPVGLHFWDEVPWSEVAALERHSLVLTDHNKMTPKVAEFFPGRVEWVIDHHANSNTHVDAKVDIDESLGSCCTLVAEAYAARGQDVPIPEEIGRLLLGVILLDCRNFSPEESKGTPRDQLMADLLAGFLPASSNEEWFKQLITARYDVSHLSVRELLLLDTKVVTVDGQSVAFASIMDSLGGSVTRAGSHEELVRVVRDFGSQRGYTACVCLFAKDATGRKAVAFLSALPADVAAECGEEAEEMREDDAAGTSDVLCNAMAARVRGAPEGLSESLRNLPLFTTQGILESGFGLEPVTDFAPLLVFSMRGVISRKTLMPCAAEPGPRPSSGADCATEL